MANVDVSGARSHLDPETVPFVVGVGASAGGLKALEQFFENMPQDSGVAFVVIQHLSPDFKSLMNELLGRRTQMGIHKVTDRMLLEPNSIYLIPPGKNLVIEENQLRLSDQQRDTGQPLNFPIDIFFKSIAHHVAERAIGVVLSGTGSDGTRGLQDIHQAGGITLVQEPATAEFDGMPQSAISTGIVDQVAPPEELAQLIYHLLQTPIDVQQFRAETTLLRSGPHKLQEIISILATQDQFDFSDYRPTTLSRRIHRRCVISGFTNLDDYVQFVADSAEEQALLRNDLLISVTSFFRDSAAWEFIEHQVLPDLVNKTEDNTALRIWVTACATGEEAYSMAILTHEAIERSGRPIEAKIFATDVHGAALEKAAQGVYPESIVNDVSEERIQRYFTSKDQSFEVSRQLREMLIFAPHNLVKDAGFTRMRFISCRNVLIYMEAPLQQRVLRQLHFSLKAQGVLFLGSSETLADLHDEFKTLDQHHKVYQKLRDVRLPLAVQGANPLAHAMLRHRTPERKTPQVEPILNAAFKLFLDERQITALIVNPDHHLLHVCGDPLNVLQVPDGRVTLDLTKMVSAPIQLPLSTALHRAQRSQEIVEYTGLQIPIGGTSQTIGLKVTYQPSSKMGKAFLLVEIAPEKAQPSIPAAETFEADTEVAQRIMQLEHELQQTRENLQATIEELETTNEEQQATNEELVASNEELQSTNEELHAVNEELYTVNAEYQSKIQELTNLNNDVDNLLFSTDIGVVFLDTELKIRKFTPAATRVLSLMGTDVGRPLAHFAHNLDCPNLMTTLTTVMQQDQYQEQEVRIGPHGSHLLMRVHPYQLPNQLPQGVVISFVDITTIKQTQNQLQQEVYERQRAQAALVELNATLEQQVEAQTAALTLSNNQLKQEAMERAQAQAELDQFFQLSLNLLCIADLDGHFKRINPSFETLLDYSTQELLEKPFLEFIHPDDISPTVAEVDKLTRGKATVYFENRYRCRDGSYRWLAWSCHPSVGGKLYATATDITELKQVQTSLKQKNAELAAIFKAMPDSLVFVNPQRQIVMVNPAFNRVFGYQSGAVLGQFTQILYADPKDFEAQGRARFNLTAEEKLKPYEVCYRHQNGETFPGETVATKVQDDEGNVLGFVGMVRDIRDRKAAEREINRQLMAIESSNVGVAILDPDRYIYVNPAHAQIFGYKDPQEIVGQSWRILYEPEQVAQIEQEVFSQLQKTGRWQGETKAKHQDGYLIDEELSLTLTPAGDLICVCQEITERKEIETLQANMMEALRSNKDLELFAYVASHDLREPLRKVKSFSELLVDGYKNQLDETAQRYIDFIMSGIIRMESLIQDLLTYSQLGQETNTLVTVDLNTVVQTVLGDLQITIEEQQASITTTELPTVTANPTAMQQLFLNLIGNAIKFRGQAPPHIHIAVQQKAQQWLISIQDNGIGMVPEYQKRIFVIFQRLHNRDDYPGTGIGLALCRKIVENYGGHIWVDSEVGQGSTFYFTLPL